MKRTLIFVLSLLVLHACKPEKPWSPSRDESGKDNPPLNPAVSSVLPHTVDIGDAEQGIYLEGTISPESLSDSVHEEKTESRRGRMAIVNVTITPPVPDKLWATYLIKCTREFTERPVVLRAQIMVEGKSVGSIEVVLGKDARTNEFATSVDLLSQFDQVPASFLATVEGELLLMPEGIDESTINPETATSDIVSKAVEYNPIRVDIEGAPAGEPLPATEAVTTEAAPEAPSESSPDEKTAAQ